MNYSKMRDTSPKDNGRSYGDKKFFGDRNSGKNYGSTSNSQRHEMHKTVCTSCRADCTVPFRPSGGKPVLCSDCYKNKGGSHTGSPRKNDNRDIRKNNSSSRIGATQQPPFDYQPQLDAINKKLATILVILAPDITVDTPDIPATVAQQSNTLSKKAVDADALKAIITQSMIKKTTKKAVAKKPAAKKVVKKAVAKKVVKKAVAKKVVKKKK